MRRMFAHSRHLVIALLIALSSVPSRGQELDDLRARLAQIEAGDYAQDSAAYVTNYPFARLQLRKAQALNAGGGSYFVSATVSECVALGLEALDRLQRGKLMRAEPGVLTELAYITRNDHTAQPYHLYLPPDYEPQRATPLIVFLHGWVPTTNILDPWVPPDNVLQIAGKYGCMLLTPYGRRNTDFQGVGEVDVLRAIEEVRKLYSVNERRIYLNGVSMGAMGAWTIALRHPGVFAAVTPIAGQTDMYRWWRWDKQQMPPFKQWMVEWDNPWHLAKSMRSQRFYVQHGEYDSLIPAEQSRLMVEKAKENPDLAAITYVEYPGASHFIYFETEPFEKAFAWQMQHTLQERPMLVSHTTYSLEYGTAFWATIEQFEEWRKPASFSILATPWVQKLSLAEVEIECENVARLSIDVANSPLRAKDSYIVSSPSGRKTIRPHDGKLIVEFGEKQDSVQSFPPAKRKGLCGPCEEVFDTSFIVVQGTAGGPAADAELEAKVQRFSEEWDAFADGYPRMKLDTEITEEDIAESNLVLFGRPQTNHLLARIYFRLPVRIGDHRYKIGDNEYAGDDLGLAMCYPNPLNPDRYVLIFSGEYWGERCDVNHKFDMLPDFIVFTTSAFAPEGDTNEHLCAGFFDNNWQLSDELTYH